MPFLCLLPILLAADPPAFVLQTANDEQPAGALVRVATDGTTQVNTAPPVVGAELVAIRRQGLPPPHFPHDRPHALFANGDRLPGRVIAIKDDKVRFQADLGTPQEMTVPLSSLKAVWLSEGAAARAATAAGRRVLAEKRRHDAAVLTNGDAARGTIVGWAADGPLRLEAGGILTEVPRDRVQALLLNSELSRAAKPRSTYRQILLLNGARLSVRTAELAEGVLQATTLTGGPVRIPVSALAAVNVYRGPAVYLSDLTPVRYEFTPYLATRWPVANDQTVAGLDLRLGGGTYDKGVALHSQCRVTYAVPAGARRFEAVVGLDEVTGRVGHVVVRVTADDRALLLPTEVGGGDLPRTLRQPLPAGAREVTLAVEFGRGGDVLDHVNWADARFILGGVLPK